MPLLAGCVSDEPRTVALLVADESADGAVVDVEAFTERVEATCEECEVEVHDAGGDAADQLDQARQVIDDDAAALVIWPVQPEEVEGLSLRDTPMVSLVRLVPGSDGFVGLADDDPDLRDQGSDLEAAREVVLGDRNTMTHVPARAMSEQAADVVVGQLADDPAPGSEEHEGVPSWLYDITEVDLDSLTTVLVGEGVITLEELCEGSTARRCARFGLR